jgi:hypothetical protein
MATEYTQLLVKPVFTSLQLIPPFVVFSTPRSDGERVNKEPIQAIVDPNPVRPSIRTLEHPAIGSGIDCGRGHRINGQSLNKSAVYGAYIGPGILSAVGN